MKKKSVRDNGNSSTGELSASPSGRFATATLELARAFVLALLTDDSFTADVQRTIDQQNSGQTYLSMDEKMAKVLYTILKLQHPFARPPSKGDATKGIPHQPDRKTIERFTGLSL